MALVKKSRLAAGRLKRAKAQDQSKGEASASSPPKSRGAVRASEGSRRAKMIERIAAASEQLSSGLTQLAAAAEELNRSMQQIAAGAEEAAGAAQEQSAAVKSIVAASQE